jgi:hypothetical protein
MLKQAFLPRKKRRLHLFKPNKNANIPSTSINNCDANVENVWNSASKICGLAKKMIPG